ncbi:MAG TPA: AI-2E family transporter [Candidatus Limnocylindria bacterium]|nr:AI-2E family transporter [Candidatus Limnocylindria bacterium]
MSDFLAALRRHRLGLFVAATGVLLAWLLWSARGALPAFVIGLALAFVLDPLVTAVERRGVPRWGGVLIAYAAVVAVVWALAAFAVAPLADQTRDFVARLPELGAAIGDLQHGLDEWYRSLPLPADLRGALDEAIARAEAAFGQAIRDFLGPAVGTLVRTVGFVIGLVVVPVWLFFVLRDRERLPRALAAAVPPRWRADAENVLAILARVGGRWVRGQLILGVAIFLATVVGLTALTLAGFREFGAFTLVLALIAGVLEWFPIIGPIVAAVPAILVGITISPAAAIAAVVLYVGIQQLENNLLVPKILGDAVELHPAVLIVALVVGGALFGIGGAILAAPVVASGRDLYRYAFARLSDETPERAFAGILGRSSNTAAQPLAEPEVSATA